MDTVITLPLAAVDVLGEQLGLDLRQYPFEIPRVPPEERDGVAERVRADLSARELLDGGTPVPELSDALYLLSRPNLAVSAAGLLDVQQRRPLAARAVATGEVAVLGVLSGRELHMEFRYSDDLAAAAAEPLPAEHAGDETARTADVLEWPKRRLGHFVVAGPRGRMSSLAWFDTGAGRYAMRTALDAETVHCEPADRQRLVALIQEFLDACRS